MIICRKKVCLPETDILLQGLEARTVDEQATIQYTHGECAEGQSSASHTQCQLQKPTGLYGPTL